MRFQKVFTDSRIRVQQCVDEGVGLYNRHNLHHTDHMKIYNQRNADLQYSA